MSKKVQVGDRVILKPSDRTEELGLINLVNAEVMDIVSNYSYLLRFDTVLDGQKYSSRHEAYFTRKEFFRVGDKIITTSNQINVPVWSIGTILEIKQNGDIVARFLNKTNGLFTVLTLGGYDWTDTNVTLDDGSSPIRDEDIPMLPEHEEVEPAPVLGVVKPEDRTVGVAEKPESVVRFKEFVVVRADAPLWESDEVINFFVDRGVLHVVGLENGKRSGIVFAPGNWQEVVYIEL